MVHRVGVSPPQVGRFGLVGTCQRWWGGRGLMADGSGLVFITCAQTPVVRGGCGTTWFVDVLFCFVFYSL